MRCLRRVCPFLSSQESLRPNGESTETELVKLRERGPGIQIADEYTVSGTGAVLAGIEIEQDAAYWEVSIASLPTGASCCIGVARRNASLDRPLAGTFGPSVLGALLDDEAKEAEGAEGAEKAAGEQAEGEAQGEEQAQAQASRQAGAIEVEEAQEAEGTEKAAGAAAGEEAQVEEQAQGHKVEEAQGAQGAEEAAGGEAGEKRHKGNKADEGETSGLTASNVGSQPSQSDCTWVLSSSGAKLEKGDVIGVAFGQGEIPNLRFFQNGEALERHSVSRVRGCVCPALSVQDGAVLRVVFDPAAFKFRPPSNFTELLPTRALL